LWLIVEHKVNCIDIYDIKNGYNEVV